MKNMIIILCILLVTGAMAGGSDSHAQPKIPEEEISATIPSDVRSEILKLYSADPLERTHAAIVLSKMGERSAPAMPFIIDLLDDKTTLKKVEDPQGTFVHFNEVRVEIADVLLQMGDPAVAHLMEALRAYGQKNPMQPRDSLMADEVKWVLVNIGSAAVDPLIGALKDQHPDMRWRSAQALGEIKNRQAVEPLIAVLNDENWNVRCKAATALGEIRDSRACEPLVVLLKDANDHVRKHAANALGKIKDPRAVGPLIAALNDRNEHVRAESTQALMKTRDPRAVEPLSAILKDENIYVRINVADALGEMGDQRAVEPLIAALKDENPNVRMCAARALIRIGDPRATQPLQAALKDKNEHVRKFIERQLKGSHLRY